MKRSGCLFVVFAGVAISLAAQDKSFLNAYYPMINRAELSIAREDYAKALEQYKIAFDSRPLGFARDFRNAAICAAWTGDTTAAIGFFEVLALKGCPMSYFEDPVFAALHTAVEWKHFQAQYPQWQAAYRDVMLPQLRAELIEMERRSLEFPRDDAHYAVFRDTIRKIDSLNMRRFQEILRDDGFPSEALIGADFPDHNSPCLTILWRHSCRISKGGSLEPAPGWPDLAPDMVRAVKNGQFEPIDAALCLQMQNDPKYPVRAWDFHQIKKAGVLQPYFYVNRLSVNPAAEKARRKLGLESFADCEAKCRYLLRHPDTPFRFGLSKRIYVSEPPAATVDFMENERMFIRISAE